MRSWCLNFFEVINRFEKEPEDDYKYKQINDGECDIHNCLFFYIIWAYTKLVPQKTIYTQSPLNQTIIQLIIKPKYHKQKRPYQNGRVFYRNGMVITLFYIDQVFGKGWLNR